MLDGEWNGSSGTGMTWEMEMIGREWWGAGRDGMEKAREKCFDIVRIWCGSIQRGNGRARSSEEEAL
jgi:hypothetical protein